MIGAATPPNPMYISASRACRGRGDIAKARRVSYSQSVEDWPDAFLSSCTVNVRSPYGVGSNLAKSKARPYSRTIQPIRSINDHGVKTQTWTSTYSPAEYLRYAFSITSGP